jgi:hypothetical protein
MTLEDGPIGCPETSVRNSHSKLRKVSKERRSHSHRGGSLKSSNFSYLSSYIQDFSLYFKISEFVRFNYTTSSGTLVGKDSSSR